MKQGMKSPILMRHSLQVVPMTLTRLAALVRNHPRSAISRLVLEIARAGLSPFGQVLVQFIMVWQR